MQQLRQHGDDLFAAQRTACELNARPQANQRDIVQTWALDMRNAMDAGDLEEARRLALQLKPYMAMLRENTNV